MVGRDKTFIFNHVQFTLWYHRGSNKDGRIVRALVTLGSCDPTPCRPSSNSMALPALSKKTGKVSITYSYSVFFKVKLSPLWFGILLYHLNRRT